jgi:HK97 family phage major capsid protein
MAQKLPQAFLNGLPIFFTEKLPTLGTAGDVMLVDWSKYVIGNRMEMQIDVSNQYKFQNNQLCWRVITRCDGRPWLNDSIQDANGWTVSPFVYLN